MNRMNYDLSKGNISMPLYLYEEQKSEFAKCLNVHNKVEKYDPDINE